MLPSNTTRLPLSKIPGANHPRYDMQLYHKKVHKFHASNPKCTIEPTSCLRRPTTGEAHMTSHNRKHGGLHEVLGEWYINAHSFIIKDPDIKDHVWNYFILDLDIIIYQPKHTYSNRVYKGNLWRRLLDDRENKMPVCAAVGCTRRTGSGQQYGHKCYSFPLQNPDLLNKWLAKMKRKGFVPTKSSRLCSGHFLDTCFQEDLYAKYVGVAKFLNVEPTWRHVWLL